MRRSSSSTADATHPSIHHPSPKRRRVALACGNCRERKVRCDGGRPVCKACQRRGSTEQQPCEYLVVADTAKYQSERAYLHTLREHIAHLESSAQQQTGNPEQTGKPNGTNESIREAPIPTVEQQTGDLPASSTLPHSISAMGTALPDTEDDKREQYYGQPSIVSLVQECAQASPGQDSTLPFTPSTTNSSTTSGTVAKSGISMSSLISDDFSLPPRKTTDWLLDVYFTNSHLFYPWVHKESLLASYETIWSSQDNESSNTNGLPDVGIGGQNCPAQVFYCALNAILAIACEFSNIRSREKRTSSLVFYERMKGLLNIDFLDSGSLAHVQALLLVALYLQCTPYPRQCWNVVGMAYRMSVGLGLHLSQYIPELTLLEKEMRWRAWCACVQMDIILSMTMGRPAMTPTPHKVPLPSPIDDKYLAMGDDTLQPAETISPNQFLCENMRLIGILGKILSTIYHSAEPGAKVEAPRTFQVDFQSFMDIDRALEDFESSLHPALRWSAPRAGCNDTGTNLLCRRQSNVLHARYLHLKLLLYRPTFSEHCSASTSDTTNQTQQQSPQKPASQSWSSLCRSNCATACVRSACELIESLATATLQDATGAWWYGVFCKSPFHPIPSWSEPVLYTMQSVNCSYIVVTDLITAGVILVAADSSGVAVPLDGYGVDKVMQESAWDQCLRTLHRMVDVHPSARDYALALGGLKQRHRNTASNMGNHRHDHSATAYRAQSLTNPVATPSPFLSNWDNGLEDIMLPAHWLQDVDEGLLLPNLF